jgi:hypothetical protein
MPRYHRPSRDANHKEISDGLVKAGRSVLDLSPLGGDAPDLLVGYQGVDSLLEIKCRETGHHSTTNPVRDSQLKWHAAWRGKPVQVVWTLDDALRATDPVG